MSIALSVLEDEANVYYTPSGTDPDQSSTRYVAPVEISLGATLSYVGIDAAGNSSAAREANYIIDSVSLSVQVTLPTHLVSVSARQPSEALAMNRAPTTTPSGVLSVLLRGSKPPAGPAAYS